MATTVSKKNSLGLDNNIEPAVTPPPPPPEGGTTFARKPKLTSKSRKREIPEGLWTKCPRCSAMIFDKELDENLKVCPTCNHHFTIGARERIHSLVETCTFEEMDASMISVDVLGFTGASSYKDKLNSNWRKTNLKDAVITGIGAIGTHRVALGVMDFSFLGGSMGSVVGEKLTRLIEKATEKELPLIIISTRAPQVLAICIRLNMPSYMRAPPLVEMMTTGRAFSVPASIRRVSFSPTTDPIEPPRKLKSITPSPRRCFAILPMPVMTASFKPV